jgi:hypothetical protein
MKVGCILFYLLTVPFVVFSQKNNLNTGDAYAEDQVYVSVSYNQFTRQPSSLSKSSFSYAFSGGFIKDIILNKKGTIAVAAGIGYGYDFFSHELRIDEVDGNTVFGSANTISENIFTSRNLEFPFEFRWRTSTATKYSFWRVYSGIKVLYNLQNKFQYIGSNETEYKVKNVSAYNKWQYGLTMSAGYDAFNVHVFYGMTPLFKNGTMNGEAVNSTIIKFGLIFYML